MFAETTKQAVLALVAADADATPEERMAVANAVRGLVPVSGGGRGDDLVISFLEASRRLGHRNAQFARNLAKQGRLACVYGSGRGIRPCGVTAKSVEDFAAAAGG